jgi:hypothetical protein
MVSFTDILLCMCIFLLVQKKRVWFPDPEVSGTKLFSAFDAVDGSCANINKQRSPRTLTKMLSGMRRKARRQRAAISSDTIIHDESSVSAFSSSMPSATSTCGEGWSKFVICVKFQAEEQ